MAVPLLWYPAYVNFDALQYAMWLWFLIGAATFAVLLGLLDCTPVGTTVRWGRGEVIVQDGALPLVRHIRGLPKRGGLITKCAALRHLRRFFLHPLSPSSPRPQTQKAQVLRSSHDCAAIDLFFPAAWCQCTRVACP